MPCYQIKGLANDHRTAKRALDVCTPLEKTNTSTFRGCTDAENKIWGVHVDLSSAPRTSFNVGVKGLQIPNFDPIACQSPVSPWLNSVTSCGATAQQLFRWFSCRSVIACFFSVYQVMKTSIKSHCLHGAVECGEMCGRMNFPLKLKCAVLNIYFFFLLCWKKKNPLFIGEISYLHNVSRKSIQAHARVYYL